MPRPQPRGFAQVPDFITRSAMPDGPYRLLSTLLGLVWGKKAGCDIGQAALGQMMLVGRQTVSRYLRVLVELEQVELIGFVRGDRRRRRIIVLIKNIHPELLKAIEIASANQPDAMTAYKKATIGGLLPKKSSVKKAKGEYIA